MRIAKFTYGNGVYYPADKNAIAATALLSRRFIREKDINAVRSVGYIPYLMNGKEIGKVDIKV